MAELEVGKNITRCTWCIGCPLQFLTIISYLITFYITMFFIRWCLGINPFTMLKSPWALYSWKKAVVKKSLHTFVFWEMAYRKELQVSCDLDKIFRCFPPSPFLVYKARSSKSSFFVLLMISWLFNPHYPIWTKYALTWLSETNQTSPSTDPRTLTQPLASLGKQNNTSVFFFFF